MTVSAPLVYSLIRLSGPRTTTDIRFLDELNSQTLSISYSSSYPLTSIKMDFGFLVCPVSRKSHGVCYKSLTWNL